MLTRPEARSQDSKRGAVPWKTCAIFADVVAESWPGPALSRYCNVDPSLIARHACAGHNQLNNIGFPITTLLSKKERFFYGVYIWNRTAIWKQGLCTARLLRCINRVQSNEASELHPQRIHDNPASTTEAKTVSVSVCVCVCLCDFESVTLCVAGVCVCVCVNK